MSQIDIGKPAPDFKLDSGDGDSVALSGFKGRKVAVIFYPRAGTGTCTSELVDFSALAAEFSAADTELLAISDDAVRKLRNFGVKNKLTPTLLSDPDHAAIEAYGVWVEKKMYGRAFMAVERASYLVDRTGKIARIWRKVSVPGHAKAVLEAAKALS